MKVWILFSVANDYNQPEKAFEKLFWEKPTGEEIVEQIGYNTEIGTKIANEERIRLSGCEYWLEEFTKPV